MTGTIRVPARVRKAEPRIRSEPAPPMAPAAAERRAPVVHLREVCADDAGAIVAAARASRRLHGAWVSPPLTTEDFARRREERRAAGNAVSLLAVRTDDDALLGLFSLSEIIRGALQQAFVGYYAFAPHAGRGYMREGMRLLLGHAFGPLGLHRIEANVQPGNERSIALVRACGFVREGFSARYLKIAGRWRDHERWAINADDWNAQRRGSAGASPAE